MKNTLPQDNNNFLKRVWLTGGVIFFFIAISLFVWHSYEILLLIFAGMLFGILLRAPTNKLCALFQLKDSISLGLVLIVTVALITALGVFLVPNIGQQFGTLVERIPENFEKAMDWLRSQDWSDKLLSIISNTTSENESNGTAMAWITKFFTTSFGAVGNFVIIFFLGVFFAASPQTYLHGFLQLVPQYYRNRSHNILNLIGRSLRWWFIGKLASMLVITILTSIGLYALGVPLALSLGIIAGLLSFVPNIGPALSFIPAALVALGQGSQVVLFVAILFLVIQTIESYLITPVIQQKTISIPPALLLSSQLLFAVFAGVLGLIFATPLAAAIIVLVREIYVKDTLEGNIVHDVDSINGQQNIDLEFKKAV